MRILAWDTGLTALIPILLIGTGCGSGTSTPGRDAGTDADAEADAGADDAGADVDAGGDAGGDGDADGDGGERGPMQLLTLPDAELRGAVCNDGSAAGYYYRPGVGEGADLWVIHLQGGGMCFDVASCTAREQEFPQRMTSALWPAERPGEGAHSVDPVENPDFWHAHHVYLPYCSSDLWSGDREASDATSGRAFRGARIVDAVLDDLADPGRTAAPNLADASRILFSGSSAGGAGVLAHLDSVAARFPSADVRGLDDAGWFVDTEPYDSSLPSPAEALTMGRALWSGLVDASCDAAHRDAPGACWVGPTVYPTIETPMLVQIAQRDGPQLGTLGIRPPLDAEERAYVEAFAERIATSLEPVTACFSPSGATHGLMLDQEFGALEVQGTTLREVLGLFFFDRPGAVHVVAP